eukprot:gnl/TRDRNA2_/TRDRNA2_174673_c0_seq1.p1 gnl/TRDRNA2_/TRDRNA2_174673_c0~~gnl/TRDRNA2_/TRDRNA2_174673_c0_seq1.p1  ORF type:complete len:357 (+),score=43.39 gnl/TRDRNA2_/TRDRNA2_174673_c0_seq1:72-1142(+)
MERIGALPTMFVMMGVVAGTMVNFFRDYMVVLEFLFPIHWVWLTMVGYVMTLPFHYCAPKPEQTGKTTLPWTHYAVCMLLDAAGMICSYWALGALSAAIAQMMRGCKLVIVTAMKCCMGIYPQRHHIFGMVICMGGLALVVAGSFVEDKKEAKDDMHPEHEDSDSRKEQARLWQAFALCFAAEVFFASFVVFQEHVVRNYEVTPYQLIGWMGVIGSFAVGVFLLIADLLVLVEDSSNVIGRATSSQILQLVLVAYMITQGCKMLIGFKISQLTSAEVQVFVELATCASIWIVEIALGWVRFQILHLFGFLLIAFGMITYVGMIPLLRAEASEESLPFSKKAEETQSRNDSTRHPEG